MQHVADSTPWARAVIRDGRVTLNAWSSSLMTGGPVRAVLRPLLADGVVLADLVSEPCDDGRDELVVHWVPAGRTSPPAEAALLRWAERVGYRRVWLPDAVIDFSDSLPTAGCAETRCPTCGARWDDESPEFWAMVRSQGCFPGTCPICNGSLPEWEPMAGAAVCAAGGIEAASQMLDRALAEAFDRMDAFCAVQRADHGTLTAKGVERLQQAVGVGDAERRVLLERLPPLGGDAPPGGVLLGVLLGLFAAEAARR